MKLYQIITGLLLIAIVQGCATLNKDECRAADWKAIGYEDGSEGYQLSDRFRQHRKACSKHGIKAKFDLYKLGHEQGIRRYCTPRLGYKLGKYNDQMPNNCPADLIESVGRGYAAGHEVYLDKQAIRREIDAIQDELDIVDEALELHVSEIQEHEKYLHIAEEGLSNPQATALEKVVFYTQRDKMRKLVLAKENQIESLDAERAQYQHAIDGLQKEIRFLDKQPMPRLK